jgi:hypothetical protein
MPLQSLIFIKIFSFTKTGGILLHLSVEDTGVMPLIEISDNHWILEDIYV